MVENNPHYIFSHLKLPFMQVQLLGTFIFLVHLMLVCVGKWTETLLHYYLLITHWLVSPIAVRQVWKELFCILALVLFRTVVCPQAILVFAYIFRC